VSLQSDKLMLERVVSGKINQSLRYNHGLFKSYSDIYIIQEAYFTFKKTVATTK
jgi:hypothetical protein